MTTTNNKDYLIAQAERMQANRKEAHNDMLARLEEVREAQNNEEKAEKLHNKLLACEVTTTYRLLLCCGGPTSQFYLHKDSTGIFFAGEYITTDNPDGVQVAQQLDHDEIDLLVEFYNLGEDY